ncbi:hypothetical protein [Xanthomarina sp. GH4-25]|uniref:hypothetical protein n=1 Tax=Xanthomarina sp. GH4-25 TaxID=3349335 RepID=UPI000D67E2A4|nr:hypothetical protein DI383_10340 [Flavobacteriaceae bacterium LYZ1037]
MKHVLVAAMLCCLVVNGYSQEEKQTASVEKSIFGIQTGAVGIWIHGEFKLSNKFVLRAETGLDMGVWENSYNNDSGVLLGPVFTLEPRFYYNLNKRLRKGKRTEGNSGNFIGLKTSYHPDLFTIGTNKDVNIIRDITIVPTWGIKRNIGKHFNYEAGFGIGYIHFIDKYNLSTNKSDVAVNLHARIGYKF